MEENPHLKSALLEVVENQLKANDPPETRKTLERLTAKGYPEYEAKKLIACVVASEIFDVLKKKELFNLERFVKALNALPKLPED
ncbi:MAG: hypothetical protein C0403_12435 [Desulfobacterium sp.]|nr:hypothetical protein [Desulfobacterium sp.]